MTYAMKPDEAGQNAELAFPGAFHEAWKRACGRLDGAGYGAAIAEAYRRNSPRLAGLAGPQAALDLASAVSGVAIGAGRGAAKLLAEASLHAGGRLGARTGEWLRLVENAAAKAPESASALLERTEFLLSRLDLAGYEAWLRVGIRSGNGEPARRLAFFRLEAPEAQRWLERETGIAGFTDYENRLKPFFTALWGLTVPMREVPPNAPEQVRRRPGFDGAVMRLPSSFPGFQGDDVERLYRCAVAHIGAHCRFTHRKFPIGGLKPAQVALVSLIEDARVEQLAMRALPGLRRLMLPFHVASPGGQATAAHLFARLSRALVDPGYEDPDGWVAKGREAFFSASAEWEDQDLSRRIGDLLGNDLGQMRIQFDAKNYIVQPPYRDDNNGLWDFGDDEDQQYLDAEHVFEAARIREEEDDSRQPDRTETEQRDDQPTGEMTVVAAARDGVPVARYPEFDHVTGRDQPDWTTIREYAPRLGPPAAVERMLEDRPDIVNRLTALIRAARVSRAERMRRQAEGEYLDIDACISAAITRRAGESPDTRIYGRYERRSRDLSTLLLLDVSQSTADRLVGSGRSVLDVEKQASALLAHAISGLGDPFAIAAFSSDGREDVHYVRVKDFERPYDRSAFAHLAGLESGLSTRLGAAMRHAGAELARQRSYRRLLLVVTDGEPSDRDADDPRYLVEDARKAVHSLSAAGINAFCVALDAHKSSYPGRIFGQRNAISIDSAERLVGLLPQLYIRLGR